MDKKHLFFYLFTLSLLAYELVNRPLLWLENDGHMNTMEYQILFQVMVGTLGVAFIGLMELYNLAQKEYKGMMNSSSSPSEPCETGVKYIHTHSILSDDKE